MTQIGEHVRTVQVPKPLKAPLIATPITVPIAPVREKVEVRCG